MAATQPESPPIIDVWSRTSAKYRWQAVIMLILLLVLFGGLCCFLYWLRTGVIGPWNDDGYLRLMRQSFQPTGADQVTLIDFLRYPINVQEVPVHGVTMGLLLATLGSIPVLVAILYRFPYSVMFAAMVVFLAGMPWLGVTTFLGCVVASLRWFRFSFRYASALLGLVPIAVYFVSASWEPAGAVTRSLQNRALLYAPWVLAVVGSCLICALALLIAKIINYRPGGIPPLLAVLFAVPVILFYSKIGRDELDYRILEREIGPTSRVMFVNVDLGAEVRREATRRLLDAEKETFDEVYDRLLAEAVDEALEAAEDARESAALRCDSFMAHYPNSRYVPNVLYLKGRAIDQRVNRDRLKRRQRIEFYSDNPSPRSRRTWETLVERFPESPLSAVALLKLATLEAREGDFKIASELLARLRTRFGEQHTTTQPDEAGEAAARSVFLRAPPQARLAVDAEAVARRGWLMQEMIAACRDDAARPAGAVFAAGEETAEGNIHPLQAWFAFDESDSAYVDNLQGLVAAFPGSTTACFAEVRLASRAPSLSNRISRLRVAADQHAGRPCGAAALFHLAEACDEDSLLEDARDALTRLTRDYPEACWAQDAKDRLSSIAFLATEPQ